MAPPAAERRAGIPGIRGFYVVFGVVSIFIMAIGAFMLVMGVREAWRGRASLSWPSTQGTLVEREVVETSRRSAGPRTGGARVSEWIPRVRYRYEVSGTTYEGDRVDFKTRAGGRAAAEAEVAGLVAGDAVAVHFDPSDPSTSVLRPGNGPWDWIPPLIGLLGLAFPPAVFLIVRRWVRAASAHAARAPTDDATSNAPSS